ncbi:MAG: Tad domain-containing protein, partial [Pirellulales bacterium]
MAMQVSPPKTGDARDAQPRAAHSWISSACGRWHAAHGRTSSGCGGWRPARGRTSDPWKAALEVPRRPGQRSGVVVMGLLLSLVAALGLVGLTLDLALKQYYEQRVQGACDAAALAG